MSRLYGVTLHAAMHRVLRTYKQLPFCDCCRRSYNKKTKSILDRMHTDFNIEMVQFLQKHHLSVVAMEKKIQIDGLLGRVDCIFKENVYNKKLYIIDWKFTKHLPAELCQEYRIQLNLYLYIMQRMQLFNAFDQFEMYCFIFSSHDLNQLKIFKCEAMSQDFIENLISTTVFQS